MDRMRMFGEGADGPLTGRIAPGFASRSLTPKLSRRSLFRSLLERPDPVGHLLGAPKPAKSADALGAVTKLLLEVEVSPSRDALLREWLDLSPRIEAFLAEVKEKHMASLRLQIAELTPLCRASLDRMRALRTERSGLEGQRHTLEEHRGKADLNLRGAIQSKPDDEMFPTEGELAEWRPVSIGHRLRSPTKPIDRQSCGNFSRRRTKKPASKPRTWTS